ncbi:bifunctional homocysteine S-methyltransferase/methylenetetrahydrofolate reductase [Granulicella sp. WH15]|uniref:bifunctional homocysteine S-methyltransferase/methylenetetrahydrofolate reductase n=1 Tax=Granulicella sp. WH15 TaxID=2602070 RepID=UPI0013672F10|nr:bifunctional homocysteine S-methyltransferase/methylenetetrahydrofolate reductase [Granulicella sp. WH15]QHN04231.1 bifunctional homocysteine S-methyltransferase/methylenetetrahydrofolate reductase [Granulicella sp. WH15]
MKTGKVAESLFGGGSERKVVLCDGAMGSMLYGRGVFINRCYDELNLSQPDVVRGVHLEYLQAGAEVIETNTYGANSIRLKRFGLEARVAEINLAGVRLARECVDQMREKQGSEAFVAGAMGSLGDLTVSAEEAFAAFSEQVRALAQGGPGVGADLLIVETLPGMLEAEQAIRAAKAEAPALPLIVMVTVSESGDCLDGTSPEEAARRMTEWGADAIGCNCSDGPATVLSVIERMRPMTTLPLAAMPNAGQPRAIDGRSLYLTSPEYMASFARRFVQAGATFVGGCCGTTPQHTRAMRGALRALEAQATGVQAVESGAAARVVASKVEPPPLAERSRVGAKIATGAFVTMVEIVPPKGIDTTHELEGAEELHRLGVDAINVPDSPRASARMSAQSLCVQIQQRVGIETILHYTCRDRNLLSIQSDLIGASSIGLKNVLCLTGDPPKMGTYPDATAVFDVDAIGLVKIVEGLNHGLDIGGNAIGASTGFTISVAANPGVPDIDNEVRRFAAKVEAGAEFGITQPVFDMRLLEQFLKRIEGFRIPIVAGIWPLTSVKNAEFMKNDLKVSMPDEIMRRMAAAGSPEAARATGIAIAQEMLTAARTMVQGVQVSAPFGKYKAAAQVLGVV